MKHHLWLWTLLHHPNLGVSLYILAKFDTQGFES